MVCTIDTCVELIGWDLLLDSQTTFISVCKAVVTIRPELMFHLNQVYYLFFSYHVLSSNVLHNFPRKLLNPRDRAFPLGTLGSVGGFDKLEARCKQIE